MDKIENTFTAKMYRNIEKKLVSESYDLLRMSIKVYTST